MTTNQVGGAGKITNEEVLAGLRHFGLRTMHRRNGQYWIMFDAPKTLPEIEAQMVIWSVQEAWVRGKGSGGGGSR